MPEWAAQLGLGGVIAGLFFWYLRATVSHFIEQLAAEREERAQMIARFTAVVDNHLTENTRALGGVQQALERLAKWSVDGGQWTAKREERGEE